MRRRRITLSDGRYLVFYEFVPAEESKPKEVDEEKESSAPMTEEQKRV